MPKSSCTIRSLNRELAPTFVVLSGEAVEVTLRRIDRAQTDAVRRHLFGGALPPAADALTRGPAR